MVETAFALVLVVLTLATFTALGLWHTRGGVRSVDDFIAARDSAGPGMTTATLVASVMGVWILFNPAEAGAAFGGITAVAGYAVGEALPMLAYAKLGPRIRKLIPEGHTLTEYALARYGRAMYAFVLLVSLFYMFIFLAAELTAITSALHLVAGVPRWQTAVLVGGFVLLYTGYGGLRASIFTDTVQTLLILPLLVASFVGVVFALGGVGAIHRQVAAADPSLLDPTFLTGLRFGVWIGIAILGAELLNQTWWQRVYAARDAETLERGFQVAAVANAFVIFLAGLFGVVARGYADLVLDPTSQGYNASVSLFVLLQDVFPDWALLGVTLLALLLVMSTADTLFNAMASIVTADLPRLLASSSDRTLTLAARLLTLAAAVAAIVVSLRARSVLRLFLFADLLGAAVMVPLVYGLYSERATQAGALFAGVAGLAVGLAFFQSPIVRGVMESIPVVGGALPAPSFLWSFVGAAAASGGLTVGSAKLASARFDLRELGEKVRAIETPEVGP